jgi:queuine tRNA-ribosyltransferase
MTKPKYFRYRYGKIPFPVFFPDATRGVVRTLDSVDLVNTKTYGLLVNTMHLRNEYGHKIIDKFGGVGEFMSWKGALISDSGGFQVGSLVKRRPKMGEVTDEGVFFKMEGLTPSEKGKKKLLTPESSIAFQMDLGVDMVVALDDFDAPNATYEQVKESVERTILWAKRSRDEYDNICAKRKLTDKTRPYILGVIQGGHYRDLRKYCIDELVKIGFDGLGYGGEDKIAGKANNDLAQFLADNTPKDYLLYALGVGKPEDIVTAARIGFDIFDCVLPTRDARHKRLYKYTANSIKEIDLSKENFYEYYVPDKMIHLDEEAPVSTACDCLLCTNYSRSYLAYLFKIRDMVALRLSTIHNLRFYSLLMEKLRLEAGS